MSLRCVTCLAGQVMCYGNRLILQGLESCGARRLPEDRLIGVEKWHAFSLAK